MNKKSIRIISTVLTIAIVLMTLTAPVFAAKENIGGVDIDTQQPNINGVDKVESLGNTILTLIRTVGIFISIGILMLLGIKYMMGSAEEKASYKKTMMPYIVGAVILFAASTILTTIISFAGGLK